ncbi:MAG: 23S rRNA (adenine(2503)-C(2))-methyltransferase RlmN [Deltaproteobacteria bacterium]|nr:23S rRNA (adenine(2503)-C(2))-methyltransferase RlmN [Deltaproteobacteria bacterium]
MSSSRTDLDLDLGRATDGASQTSVFDLGPGDLAAFVQTLNEPAYRAAQISRWLYQRGVTDFEAMSDLSKGLRQRLAERLFVPALRVHRVERGVDGTTKYAFRAWGGDVVEAVFIPDASAPGRNTLCISSQVGCALDCKFCLTASLGLVRNLAPGEIVDQLTRVRLDLEAEAIRQSPEATAPQIGNIVLMGMGEPLQNYGALVKALEIMSSEDGPKISPRRITVSTAGLAPKIARLGRDTAVNLAISLNATTDAVRTQIMPINARWNIEALLAACRGFPLERRRRITFEYVLLGGVNDSDEDARRLVRLLRSFRCKVNLIPFNEHPYSAFERPSPGRVAAFQAILSRARMTVLVRTPRGDDISAACGQLGALVESPRSRLAIVS